MDCLLFEHSAPRVSLKRRLAIWLMQIWNVIKGHFVINCKKKICYIFALKCNENVIFCFSKLDTNEWMNEWKLKQKKRFCYQCATMTSHSQRTSSLWLKLAKFFIIIMISKVAIDRYCRNWWGTIPGRSTCFLISCILILTYCMYFTYSYYCIYDFYFVKVANIQYCSCSLCMLFYNLLTKQYLC